MVEQGRGEKGIVLVRQAVGALQEIGIRLGHSQVLGVLGEACGQVGHSEEGLRIVGEALAEVTQSGERVSEAELWRLKGELTLKQSGVRGPASEVTKRESQGKGQRAKKVVSCQFSVPNSQPSTPNPHAEAEAEACFLQAIEIARRQQAKSLELRTVISLVRLRQFQTTHPAPRTALAEAHQMLSEVYHWFTEGFDTQDLQEARTLLEELS